MQTKRLPHVSLEQPAQEKHLKILQTLYILILRISATLTSGSSLSFGSSTNRTSNPHNFHIENSNKMYFGALEFPVNC